MMRGLQRLDLSEAQEDKIFELMHQRAPNMRQQMKALKKNERELQALRQSAQFDEAQAKALIDNIARQRADIELSRLQGERQVLDVLTPEQRQKLQDLRAEKPRRMGERAPAHKHRRLRHAGEQAALPAAAYRLRRDAGAYAATPANSRR